MRCFLSQGASVLALVLPLMAAAQSQYDDPAAWLVKMSEAARGSNYQGVVVYRGDEMLETFRVMAKDSTVDTQTLMSGGIADALITTQLGLIMSIPGLLICGYLRYSHKRMEIA